MTTTLELPGPLLVAAVLVGIVILLIFGRRLARGVLYLSRAIIRLLRRVIIMIYNRTVRPIFRLVVRGPVIAGEIARAPGSRAQQIGLRPLAVILQFLAMDYLSTKELGDIPKSAKHLVQKRGWVFRWADATEAPNVLTDSLPFADATSNLQLANKYYERQIDSDSISPSILYEDSEEAFIISLLRDADLIFFFALRRIKRNVSRNIVKLISISTGLLLTFPFVISVVAEWQQFRSRTPLGLLTYVLMCALAFGGMLLVRYFYSVASTNNGTQFNGFIRNYFSKLLNQYKSAATAFANVLNDRTSALDTIAETSATWFTNMHWLSARQWLLELFVRNIKFQIGRNWWFALWLIPTICFVVAALAYSNMATFMTDVIYLMKLLGASNVVATAFGFQWTAWTIVPGVILLGLYFYVLDGLLLRFWGQVSPSGWSSFNSMNIKSLIDQNVGPLAREVVDKRKHPYGQQEGPIGPKIG